MLIAIALSLVGQYTSVFQENRLAGDYPGIDFVYKTIDYPVFFLFRGFIESSKGSAYETILHAAIIFFFASALYSFAVLFLIKFLGKLFRVFFSR